jgi:WD40 repeat protein
MGAADSFDDKPLASGPASVADGDDSLRTVGPGPPESEPTAATGEWEGRDPPTLSAPATGEATLDPSDPDDFILQVNPPTATDATSAREDDAGAEVQRTLVAPLSGDSSAGAASTAPRVRPIPVIDGYEILGELGRGGVGVVYRARQVRLNRPCALKMILAGAHADAHAVIRFLAEAEAVARLHHPNVVQIYHVGEAGGLPFFELEYLDGGSLDRQLDGTPWPARRAAEQIESLARGVAEAHRLGIVHRDLKPGNVLMAADGTPKVADFGLAKSQARESGLTQTDSIMGSPGYMAPEQAQGRNKEVGPAADVYALGAILYELLTGRPPFRAATVLETLEQVKNADAVPPSKLLPGLARDLETICLKCLQKEPSRRYATAKDLADDLQRWLDGASIGARPVPGWERGWRWAKRRPAVAALSALILLISTVSFVLVAWLWARAEERADAAIVARDRADRLARDESEARLATQRERQNAVDSLYRALVREASALRLVRKTGYRLQVRDLIKQALGSDARARNVEELRREAVACMGDFAGSEPRLWADLPKGVVASAIAAHPDSASVALGLGDGTVSVRTLPSGAERARLRGLDSSVSDVAFVPGGRNLIAADLNGAITVWESTEGDRWSRTRTIAADRPLPGYRVGRPVSIAVTPDGKTLAVCSALATSISLWDIAKGTSSGRLSVPGREQLTCLALSPDGRRLAAGYRGPDGHGALIWDLAARKLERTVAPELELVLGITFSPGGRWIACACSEGVALFDAGEFQRRLFLRGDIPTGVAFSPDDQVLAIPAEKLGALRLWDVAVNREVAVLDCPHANGAVTFSPDGRYLIASNGDAVRLWTPWVTEEKLTLPGHLGGIPGIAVNRAGTLLASAGKDRTVRIWDPASGRLLKTLADFRGPVQAVAFGPDERRLVTAEFQGGLRIWEIATGRSESLPDPGLGRPLWSIEFTPDGRSFWAQGSPQAAVWRVRDGGGTRGDPAAPTLELSRVLPNTYGACLSPDGQRLASLTMGQLVVFDVPEARPVFSVPYAYPGGARHLAFGPDGHRLVSINRRYEIEVWDTTTGQKTATFGGDPARASNSMIALSAGGDWLAEANRAVTIWDVAHASRAFQLPETRNSIWSLAWIPGQNRLAAGTSDGELVIWDLDRVRATLADLGLDR